MCDFDLPPLDYEPPTLIDEEFFPHLASIYNPGILNRQLITADAMINVPCQPIETALLLAGIKRIGAGTSITAKYVPHNRNFTVFSSGDFTYKGTPIVRVDVPPLGAETLSTHYLNSSSIWADHGCIVNATSKVAMTISGVRQKLDGVEVVQFALLLATGEVVHVMYDTDDVYSVEAQNPAIYERVGDDLFLIRGDSRKCIRHPFLSPVRAAIDTIDCGDGVIVNANGFDYRIKTEPTVTLYTAFGRTTDNNDHGYNVVNAPAPDGYGDFAPLNEKMVEFKKIRLDRTRADGHSSIVRELRSPALSAFVMKLPKGPVVEVDDVDLHVPHYEDIQEYRSASLLDTCMGPMTWNGSEMGSLITSSDVAKRVAIVNGFVNRDLIDKFCYANNIFCNGAMVYPTRRDVPGIRFKQCGMSFSTVPFKRNNLILTMCYDELPKSLRTLRGAAYCVPNRPPLVTLYIGPDDPEDTAVTFDGDGLTMRICSILRQGPADSRTLAGYFGMRAGELNKYLYSRTDIFGRVGQPLRWFLKSSSFLDDVENCLYNLLVVPLTTSEICDQTGYNPPEVGYVLRSNTLKFAFGGIPLKWRRNESFVAPVLDMV